MDDKFKVRYIHSFYMNVNGTIHAYIFECFPESERILWISHFALFWLLSYLQEIRS